MVAWILRVNNKSTVSSLSATSTPGSSQSVFLWEGDRSQSVTEQETWSGDATNSRRTFRLTFSRFSNSSSDNKIMIHRRQTSFWSIVSKASELVSQVKIKLRMRHKWLISLFKSFSDNRSPLKSTIFNPNSDHSSNHQGRPTTQPLWWTLKPTAAKMRLSIKTNIRTSIRLYSRGNL